MISLTWWQLGLSLISAAAYTVLCVWAFMTIGEDNSLLKRSKLEIFLERTFIFMAIPGMLIFLCTSVVFVLPIDIAYRIGQKFKKG